MTMKRCECGWLPLPDAWFCPNCRRPASLQGAVRDLRLEVDCRIEHGAESGGHLEYVRDRLNEIIRSVYRA